jgi:hypothetical protein
MRVGLFTILALVGLTSAVPVKLAKRGGKQCVCAKKASTNSGSGAVVQSDTSSSNWGTWWTPCDSSVSSYWVESSKTSQYGVVQCVVYVKKIPVPVPVVTTCTTTGTIVIENNITINVTVAPTVLE